MISKEWVRSTVEKRINAIYGLKNPSPDEVDRMVDRQFSRCPAFQFPGYKPVHPLFGCRQGRAQLKDHYKMFYQCVEMLEFNKQFIVVDGFSASAHYQAKIKLKESASVYDFELIGLVDVDTEERVRDLKLYFDNSTFLKAVNNRNGDFTDVRSVMPRPAFDLNFKMNAAEVISELYDYFDAIRAGKGSLEGLYTKWADDAEISFKSNTDVVPFAGRFSGKEGVRKWFATLVTGWSLATLNFTKIYTEGNTADFAMDEQHYFTNPDGSRRFLSCYIVQSWTVDDARRVRYFQSNHDSSWIENTLLMTQIYRDYYGYR
ncbi:MAG: hypothetical protein AB1898_31840 [Acidobacteriota bacterium]